MKEINTEMKALYEGNIRIIEDGQVIKGTILKVGEKDVLVDIGYKSEGSIAISEFLAKDELEVGKEIDVYVESKENDDGMVVLSRDKARRLSGWEKISTTAKEGDLIDGIVRRKVKGGFIIDVFGIEAFLPASLSSFKNMMDREILNGTFKFKIVKMSDARRSLIVSRKNAIMQEKEEAKEKIWANLKIGEVYTGTVKNITDFGAFIDLGGVDGLLHITDMSWSRISHPSEIVAVGDKVEVMILSVDKDSKKVSLGLKQRKEDPWRDIEDKFPINARVKGKIVNILPYGVFVELDAGIEGLIHVSEVSWQRRNINPQEMFTIGENIEVQIINIDRESRRISLSVKQLESNPWLDIDKKYPVGSKITGKVTGFTDYGAFVELDNNFEGMIHVSDLSWTKRVNNPQDLLKKGQKIEVSVLSVDSDNRKISLGLKQLQDNPWSSIAERYPVGSEIDNAEVTAKTNLGVFVKLENDVEGLIFSSEMNKEDMDSAKVGDKIKVKVTKIDTEQGKIGLSAKLS